MKTFFKEARIAFDVFFVKRSFKCDCNDPSCKRVFYVTKRGVLGQDNFSTCGHFKRQIKELSKIRF